MDVKTLAMFAIALLAVVAEGAEDMWIAREGKPVCTILISNAASDTERFASGEIQSYIKKISGAEAAVAAAASVSDGAAIVIGRLGNMKWPCETPRPEALGDEGFWVKRHKDKILLAGNTDRATLYAAYSFIEQEMGVRWFAPGPDGEVVHSSKDIAVSVADRIEVPSFRYRYMTLTNRGKGEWADKVTDWAVKNRLNVNLNAEEDFLRKRGGMLTRMDTHSWGRLVPGDRYFADHPEWFALINGKRSAKGRDYKLCTTNPEVVKFIAERALEYFEQYPDYELFSISQSDGLGWCECPNCTALDGGAQWPSVDGKLSPVVTDRMAKFANDVAEIVTKKFPNKYLYFLAYHSTFEPPVRFVPHPNVMINVVHSRPNYEYFNKPLESPDEKHVKFRAGLKKWLSYGIPVTVYDYSPHSQFLQLPFSAARKFAADVKFLKENGVCGYVAQTTDAIWGVYGLNYYVLAKCFWDANLNPEALLADYFSRYYGPAARPMSEFFRVLEDGLVNYEGMSNGIADYLSDDILAKARAKIEEAKALADSDLIRRRIEQQEIMLHYGELFYEGFKLEKKFNETDALEDLQSALAAYRRASEHARANAGTHAIAAQSKLDTIVIRRLDAQLKRLEKQKGGVK